MSTGWCSVVLVAACVTVCAAQAQTSTDRERLVRQNTEAKRISETESVAAITSARQVVEEARRAGWRDIEAEALHNIAAAYRALGALDLAVESAKAAGAVSAAAGDRRGEAQASNTLGLIALERGEYDQALAHQLHALQLREQLGDPVALGFSFNNLGNLYHVTGAYDRALEYHKQALALKLQGTDRGSVAFSYYNIGRLYQAMGDTSAALEAFRNALRIREQLGERRRTAQTLNSIGRLEAESDPRAALVTFKTALDHCTADRDWRCEVETENNLGLVYRRLGQTDRARETLKHALASTDLRDASAFRMDTLKQLSDVEVAAGNAAAALSWLQQYVAARDAFSARENRENMARLQAAHATRDREQRITILEQDRRLADATLGRAQVTRRALLVVLALAGISLVALFARYRTKRQSEARLRVQAQALTEALDRARTLSGLLPICASCKKIRDDNGYWTQVEAYVRAHTDAQFTHSLCPACTADYFPDLPGDAHDGPASDGTPSHRPS